MFKNLELQKMKDRNIWLEKMKDKESIWIEDCPFCKDEEETLIKKFKYWKLIKNQYPYNWINKHLLLIPYRHIEHTKFLNNKELSELPERYEFIEKFFKWMNYFSFIRETNWWKSVKHIHYHFLPGILFSNSVEWILKQQHELLKENQKI